MNDPKPCPACGGKAVDSGDRIECGFYDCDLIGPANDPEGAKWNALPRRPTGQIGPDDFCEDEHECLAVRRALSEAWISVEDRLPDVGDMVLAWVDTRGGHCQEAERSNSGPGGWWDAQGGDLLHVTHWQPKPRGPQ